METENEWIFINSNIHRMSIPDSDEWHIGLNNQETWSGLMESRWTLINGKRDSLLVMEMLLPCPKITHQDLWDYLTMLTT